jgi:hypothetical protein
MRFLPHAAHYIPWDKERSNEIRSQFGMRRLRRQTHGSKKYWLNIYRGYYQKELPCDSFYQKIKRRDPGKPRK